MEGVVGHLCHAALPARVSEYICGRHSLHQARVRIESRWWDRVRVHTVGRAPGRLSASVCAPMSHCADDLHGLQTVSPSTVRAGTSTATRIDVVACRPSQRCPTRWCGCRSAPMSLVGRICTVHKFVDAGPATLPPICAAVEGKKFCTPSIYS